jgi:DNA-binding response OmpR family regulator
MRIILLTRAMHSSAEVVPALGLLNHQVKVMGADPSSLLAVDNADALLVDGRIDLPAVRSFTRLLFETGAGAPIILITTEGNLTAVQGDWGIDDFMLNTTSPAELEARLRVTVSRYATALGIQADTNPEQINLGDLHIDEVSYSVRLRGRPLDLTFKEFELLKYLAHHPGRVFTRAILLQEVWGYDYFGGTRTVDVHVRRLRAKLGSEYEAMIGTVRNVGYRFVTDIAAVESDSDSETDANSFATTKNIQ